MRVCWRGCAKKTIPNWIELSQNWIELGKNEIEGPDHNKERSRNNSITLVL